MRIVFLVVVSIMFFSSTVSAGDIERYRCGNKFIELGMNIDQIKKACGKKRWKPIKVEKQEVNKGLRGYYYEDGTMPVAVDYYDKLLYGEYGKFYVWVIMKNGRVERINQTSKRVGG